MDTHFVAGVYSPGVFEPEPSGGTVGSRGNVSLIEAAVSVRQKRHLPRKRGRKTMRHVNIQLFGRFAIHEDDQGSAVSLEGRKVQELLAYLLLKSGRPVPRERLAEDLWLDIDPVRSKKYLRQALWQLQKDLPVGGSDGAGLLDVRQEWIAARPTDVVNVDTLEFECAYRKTLERPRGEPLMPDLRRELTNAASLYRGELLEGWYCDWSVARQDGYRAMALLVLGALIEDAELTGSWEPGLMLGRRALELDPANERIHTAQMRLYSRAGHRTAALRQYEVCRRALDEELDVNPQKSTRQLYEAIRDDRVEPNPAPGTGGVLPAAIAAADAAAEAGKLLNHLQELSHSLTSVQTQVATHIQTLQQLLV